jgi:5-hydroxyisourate hydrolase
MITTHVLDLARGVPGAGIAVTLERLRGSEWAPVASGRTDQDGRLTTLTEGHAVTAGTYRLTFDTAPYHRSHGMPDPFFPTAQIAFTVTSPAAHIHVPLLLSPFGYTTYKGS